MESHYMGKPLSEYSKPELIAIIEDMGLAQQHSAKEHIRQLNVLAQIRSAARSQ